MNMSYDEEILKAFRIAGRKGRTEISSEAILLLTDVPEQRLHEHLKSLKKFGYIKTSKRIKEKRLWKLSDGT